MFCNLPGKRMILTWLCAQSMRLIYKRWDMFTSVSWNIITLDLNFKMLLKIVIRALEILWQPTAFQRLELYFSLQARHGQITTDFWYRKSLYKTKKLFVYKYALELVLTFLLIWIIGVWNGFFLVTIKICAYLSNFASGFPKVPFCITFSNKGNWKRLLWLPGCFILSFQYYFV